MELDTDIYFNAQDYVHHFMDQHGVEVSATGDLVATSKWHTADKLFNELICQYGASFTLLKASYRQTKTFFPYNKFSKDELSSGFSLEVSARRLQALDIIRQNLVGTPSNMVEDWVRATISNPSPVDVAVYQHFIWQVKRKLFELPVSYHMMINILGPQGVGKSASTTKFLSPLKELVTERRLSELSDERNAYLLGMVGVVLLEELAGANRTDIDSLKALMSRDKIQSRVLGHNRHLNTYQNATLISTSNQTISEVVADSTGMRRFYEVVFREDKENCWAALNAIDPLELWRSVDHTAPPYVLPFLDQIIDKQNNYVRKSLLQLFLESFNYQLVEGAGVKKSDFWEQVKDFSDSNQKGFSFDSSKSHHELRRLFGSKLETVKVGNSAHYNLAIPQQSSLQDELKRKLLG